jgi:hypothetical protein
MDKQVYIASKEAVRTAAELTKERINQRKTSK